MGPQGLSIKGDKGDSVVGPQGIQGIQGVPGRDGDLHYRHTQSVPSNHWVVDHNLGKFPNVVVRDSAGQTIDVEVYYENENRLLILVESEFSGTADCN